MTLPDPNDIARREADNLTRHRTQFLDFPLERILADSPFIDRRTLLAGIADFHRDRMARTPDPVRYPESPPWVEMVRETDRRFQGLTGLSDTDLAVYRSLNDFIQFRGIRMAATHRQPVQTEKCRVAYLPDSDHGPLHLKNLDDPKDHWQPEGKPTWLFPCDDRNLFSDAVGNGLHLDEDKLATTLADLPRSPAMDTLITLFTRPWPEGLRKTGQRLHPDQGIVGYTLITLVVIHQQRRLLRWQRSALPDFNYPETPETFVF